MKLKDAHRIVAGATVEEMLALTEWSPDAYTQDELAIIHAVLTLVSEGREAATFERAAICRSSWGGRHEETEDEWNADVKLLRALDGGAEHEDVH